MTPIPSHSLDTALNHCKQGGRLVIATCTRTTVIEQKHITRWDKSGKPLLREDGDGYRLRMGRGSVYLLPGQLKMVD